MSDMTAEELAKLIVANNVLDARQVETVFGELGSRDISLEEFSSQLLRRELLTNFQLDRLMKREKGGYIYGDYKVLYLVGTGTFARVYRAVNMKTGKVFAIKVLRKRFRDDPANTEQFLREGEIGARLRHPNIVPIYEVSRDKEPYLVLEFVEGTNLRSFVKSRRKFTPKEAVGIMIDICSGLAYATEKGMSHRDLKLSNVLITSRGRCKLVDFGLAGIAESHREGIADESINTRTIDYAGLERATGVKKDDPRSDIFFAGCIFYHILTGVPPLTETKDRLQRMSVSRFQSMRPVQTVDPDLPRAVVSVVNRALELNADRRYARAADMVADLKNVLKRLEEGTADVEIGAVAAKGEKAAETGEQEGQGKTIMLLESKMELQNTIRDALKKRGYRVLVIGDPNRALARFSEFEPLPADALVVSAVELAHDALRVFNTFGEMSHTRKVPVIMIIDPKQSILLRSAKLAGHRVVMTMPLKVKELRDTLKNVFMLVPSTAPATETT